MSSIIETAWHLMAVMSPQTGTRSNGVVTVTAISGSVTIPRSSFALPVIGGQLRPDLVFKVGEGPNADKSWTATSGGTDIGVLSNIGGARHNIPNGTQLQFVPPISGLASVVSKGAFANGLDPTFLGGIKGMVLSEDLGKADFWVDIARSNLNGFPAVVVTWQGRKDIDAPTRHGTAQTVESYTISILSNRMESQHLRRLEGAIALDAISSLLVDRHAVDGIPFSNPEGIRIPMSGRQSGNHKIFQTMYIYYASVEVSSSLVQTDSRTYSNWELTVLDVTKPQVPPLPNQGDLTIVDDNEIDMTP